MSTNPIPMSDMWATKTLAELQNYIDLMNKQERGSAYNIMMLTLNTCHAIVDRSNQSNA
jgi:hypothetical protein